jgi:hypothetical protein
VTCSSRRKETIVSADFGLRNAEFSRVQTDSLRLPHSAFRTDSESPYVDFYEDGVILFVNNL